MARSPLTLAASVTSALPRAGVVGVAELTEHAAGRFDAAVVHLDDASRVVVRVPTSPEAADELAAQVRVLRALSAGVRGVLPFRAPELLGETAIGSARAVVSDLLPGFRVEAAHVPVGRGVATSLGAAIAAIHALPPSVVRDAGLPSRAPSQSRDDAERLLDRAEGTGLLPFGLLRRWSTALGTEALWRFESAVTLGGVEPTAFLLEEIGDGYEVTGLLDWHGLSVGDPAADLRWLASVPDAADDVFAGYAARAHRAPDAHLRDRARLYAEMEFAKWLVHGHGAGSDTIVTDALALLESLADGVGEAPLVDPGAVDLDEALTAVGRMPGASTDAVDTSMHTDTYDAAELALFTLDEEPPAGDTTPLDLGDWTQPDPDDAARAPLADAAVVVDAAAPASAPEAAPADSAELDHDDAARNALRRWTTAE